MEVDRFSIPDVIASEMAVKSVQSFEELKKVCVIGLRQMKKGIYDKLAKNLFFDAPGRLSFFSKTMICSLPGVGIPCKCSLLHDESVSKRNWKGMIEMRVKLVGLVSLCQELPGSEMLLSNSVKIIMNFLFPSNSFGVDFNALGEKLHNPSLKFCLEQYLAIEGQKQAGTMEFSIREYLLRIISKTPAEYENPNPSDPLHNLIRVQSWAASISRKESLRYYVMDGIEFATVIFRELQTGKKMKFNPNLLLNCLDLCVSAFVASMTRFFLNAPAILPSSLVARLALVEPNLLSNFQRIQKNDFMTMLFMKEILYLFSGGAVSCLGEWLNDQEFDKTKKSNFTVGLLKLIFTFYLNFPQYQLEIRNAVFISDTFDRLEEVYFVP